MIVSPDGSMLVSTLGWVGKGGLCVWPTDAAAPSHLPLGDARYVAAHDGRDGYFSAAHYFERFDRFELTAHRFEAPGEIAAAWRIAGSRITFEGDPAAWRHLKPCYTGYLDYRGSKDARLFLLGDDGALTVHVLPWFDDSYDKGYQGLTGVHPVPSTDHLIFGIQRCSEPVIYDPVRARVVRRIELAGRYGNCDLRFRDGADELWAVDYDTLVVLDTQDWRVNASRRMQEVESGAGNTQLFVGNFCLHDDARLCSVAQPYDNAVATVETASLQTRHVTPFDFQPLDVAVVDGTVFARDWKTGTPARRPLGG